MSDPRIQAGHEAAHPEPPHDVDWLLAEAQKRSKPPVMAAANLAVDGTYTVSWRYELPSGSEGGAFGSGETAYAALADAENGAYLVASDSVIEKVAEDSL